MKGIAFMQRFFPMRLHIASMALLAALALARFAFAQQRTERTLDEIKTEAIHRAENGMYLLIGLDPADVKEAFASIHTKDKDEWAAAFMKVGDRYANEAKGPVPLVIAVNGLDSRKEDLSESFAGILPFGIGFLAVDGPGTGQAPIKVSEHADRMLSAVIDYAQSRPEIDKNRLAIHGVSWGAYWATKMAIVERVRLRGTSAQSPPVDAFFEKDFLMNHLFGNREYLFDQAPALMSIIDGANSIDDMTKIFPNLSLVKQGLLGQPMAPMLVIGGVLDTQVPIEDLYLLMSKGDVPKTAWINPQGGHLGRQVKVWPDPLIFKQVIIPWLVRTLQAPDDKH